MSRYPTIVIFALFALCFLFSCKPKEGEKTRQIVASKGLPSELLLVVDKQVWQSDVADSLISLTQGDVPGLMQHEDFFRVCRIFSSYYTQKYTTMHSKLFVKLDTSLDKPMIGVSYNVVAAPQIEVTVAAPTLLSLRSILSRHAQTIRDYITDHQLSMRSKRLEKEYNHKADSLLRNSLGYSLRIPKELTYIKQGERFLWASTNRNEKDLNIVVYSYPWNRDDISTPEHFVLMRDSVMKENIPGGSPDQWMQTTKVDGIPILQSRAVRINGKTAFVSNGMWEMKNGGFGGAFVSYSQIDTASATVVVSEGFVYSPSTEKRELLRSLEASIRTLKKVK